MAKFKIQRSQNSAIAKLKKRTTTMAKFMFLQRGGCEGGP
ncbi:MAG: hypothetical protein ACI9HK_004320, partial [Pirellulaceae bacterium]